MKGCSSTRKKRGGGDYLAYPNNNISRSSNPFLAYKSKGGGSSCNSDGNSNLAYPMGSSNNNISKAYPNPGSSPSFSGLNLNSTGLRGGGNNGCSACSLNKINTQNSSNSSQYGGSCGGGCGCNLFKGGRGASYPDGLVGNSWTPKASGWPGVDGVDGNRNYYNNNTYEPVDISRQMRATVASKPFWGGRRKTSKKGGYIGKSYVDMVKYNAGSTYNAFKGYEKPVNPTPWIQPNLKTTPKLL
jgi:hypothetical protein